MAMTATTLGPQYAGASNTTQAPKEIGYLQRLSGVTDGLMAIEDRLHRFVDRLAGQGGAKDAGAVPAISGNLDGMLSTSEARIRSIMTMLGQLNDAF